MLLEVGVAHHWSNEARSVLYTQCISLRIWTVQCQVEVEVRELLLQLQEVLQEEYLVNSTSAIEVVHLAIGSLTLFKLNDGRNDRLGIIHLVVLVIKGLKHVHNKSICKLLYAIAEGLKDHIPIVIFECPEWTLNDRCC